MVSFKYNREAEKIRSLISDQIYQCLLPRKSIRLSKGSRNL